MGSQECLLELGAGTKQGVEGRKFGWKDLCDLLEMGQSWKGGCSRFSAEKLEIGIGGVEGELKIYS